MKAFASFLVFLLRSLVMGILIVYLIFMFQASRSSGETTITDDFEGGPLTLDWSSDKVTTAPNGEKFLGPFGVETVTASVMLPNGYHWAKMIFTTYAIGDGWEPTQSGEYGPAPAFVAHANPGDVLLDASTLLGHKVRYTLGVGELVYPAGDRSYVNGFGTQFAGGGNREWEFEFVGSSPGMLWGLDDVEVFVQTPEPSTGRMLLIFSVLWTVAWVGWRIRRVHRES